MQVSAHVQAVQVPDDNPMHPLFTNLFLVGDELKTRLTHVYRQLADRAPNAAPLRS